MRYAAISSTIQDISLAREDYEPTMMLLIGMWMSLTKNPMKPMMAKPMAVAMAIFENSFLSGLVHLFTSL